MLEGLFQGARTYIGELADALMTDEMEAEKTNVR
jgi:hypothetical protein